MTSDFLFTWREHGVLLVKLAWLLWVTWGLGVFLLRALSPGALFPGERIVVAAGLGTGGLSLAMLAMGAAGLYRQSAFMVLGAVLTAAALGAALLEKETLREAVRQVRGDKGPRLTKILLLGWAAAAGLSALSPPLFYDALVHHLGVPNLFLLRGGIEYLPHLMHSNFPLGTEMIYLFSLQTGGHRLAGLVNFSLWVLAAAALAAFVRRHWGPGTALTAAALFYLTVPVFLLSRYVIVENTMTLYFVLTLLCLFRHREEGGRTWIMLAGIFGGLFFSTKYVGGIFGILLPLAVLGGPPGGGRLRGWIRDAALFLTSAAVTSSPWLLKNLLFTGNPVFPAFSSLLGGKNWGPEEAASFAHDALAAWERPAFLADLARLPLDLVVNPGKFVAAANNTWFWPLTAAAAVLLLLSRKRWQERKVLTLLGGYFLLWAATFWLARFLIPAMALGAVLAALLLERVEERLPPLRVPLVLTLLVAVNAFVVFRDAPTLRAFRPALGLQSAEDYLSSRLRIHPAVTFINGNLPLSSKVLLMGETRAAYLRRDHLHQTALDRPALAALIGDARRPAEIADALLAGGISHILVNLHELKRLEGGYPITALSPEVKKAFAEFLNTAARPLFVQGSVYLYAVPTRSPG